MTIIKYIEKRLRIYNLRKRIKFLDEYVEHRGNELGERDEQNELIKELDELIN